MEHPFKFGCVFSCFKTSFSDWLVQSQVERREQIDWTRNGTFALFGLGYLGGVQYSIYVPFFSRLFPGAASYAAAPLSAKIKDVAGTRNMLMQVGLDQFVHHPLMYFPAFYGLKEVVKGGTVSDGIAKYQKNYKEDLVALWKLWVPSTIINFAFMPMALRIPWVASTSLIWTCIISYMRGGDDAPVVSPEEGVDIALGVGAPLSTIYDLGVAAKPDYTYDKTKNHLLLTASGRDRIGFIQDMAHIVTNDYSGNVIDVKAYKVGREFVTIMLIEAEPKEATAMQKKLVKINESQGAKISLLPTQPWLSDDDSPRCKDGVQFTGHVRVTGPDKPGRLESVTRLLGELDLDITSFSCNQHLVPDSKSDEVTQMFQMTGVVRAFVPIDRESLRAKVLAFEKEQGVRVAFKETEADPSYSIFKSTTIAPSSRKLVRTITKG